MTKKGSGKNEKERVRVIWQRTGGIHPCTTFLFSQLDNGKKDDGNALFFNLIGLVEKLKQKKNTLLGTCLILRCQFLRFAFWSV